MLAELQKNLEPATFVRTALTCSTSEFIDAWSDHLLLVKIDDPKGAIASTLRGWTSGPPPSTAIRKGWGHTIADSAVMRSTPQDSWPESLVVHQLRARLVRTLHFAVPLQKRSRSRAQIDDRFVVGRGRDSDLLLVGEGVSKLHAWLRRGDDGHYVVADNGSRNGTSVNGKPLSPQRAVTLSPGDVLCVGNIEIMFCPTGAVWAALRKT